MWSFRVFTSLYLIYYALLSPGWDYPLEPLHLGSRLIWFCLCFFYADGQYNKHQADSTVQFGITSGMECWDHWSYLANSMNSVSQIESFLFGFTQLVIWIWILLKWYWVYFIYIYLKKNILAITHIYIPCFLHQICICLDEWLEWTIEFDIIYFFRERS